MANERGHPKLSYEVWRINFHPQVAKENQLLPFKLFLPRINRIETHFVKGSTEDNSKSSTTVDPEELSREAADVAATHRDLRCAYETAHEIAVYANDMMVAGRINGFNVR